MHPSIHPSVRLSIRPSIPFRCLQAILLSTHSMEEAQAMGSRVAIMTGGVLRCIGTAKQLHLACVRPALVLCVLCV